MNYLWHMKDLPRTKNGYTVFSCFSCAGGSTLGYKLAGYDVIGNLEVDPSINKIYQANNNPKYSYTTDIRDFRNLPVKDLPKDLTTLDVLDGSPPCTSFSMMGQREKQWGKEKAFSEGQKVQRLDDLFFEFIGVADKLRPKVVIAENVAGLLYGNAKSYVQEIFKQLSKADYTTRLFKLNAATMGVPQKRERVFFILQRSDLELSPLRLEFNERPILYREFASKEYRPMDRSGLAYKRWLKRRPNDMDFGDITIRTDGKPKNFGTQIVHMDRVVKTITASAQTPVRYDVPGYICDRDMITSQTFPQDFDFCGRAVNFILGMSVPPVMMGKIAEQVKVQWLDALAERE